jgi:hypothetical protein
MTSSFTLEPRYAWESIPTAANIEEQGGSNRSTKYTRPKYDGYTPENTKNEHPTIFETAVTAQMNKHTSPFMGICHTIYSNKSRGRSKARDFFFESCADSSNLSKKNSRKKSDYFSENLPHISTTRILINFQSSYSDSGAKFGPKSAWGVKFLKLDPP